MNRYQPYGGYDNDTRKGGQQQQQQGYRGAGQQEGGYQNERASGNGWGARGRGRGGISVGSNNDYSGNGGGRGYRGGPGPDRHSRGGPPSDQDFRPPQQSYYDGPQGSYDARPPPEQRPQEYGMQGQGYGYPAQDQQRDPRYNDRPRKEEIDRRPPLKDHDAEGRKIEKRIAAERPCRVLFIRNVKYNSDGGLLREKFGAHGEMKGFFDLINTRGLIFVTYYDIRTAISARDALQGFEISGRPIDVHYSLPRDDDMPNRRCDRDRNQGTLRVMLQDGREPLQEFELDRMFRNFGAIKGIYFTGGDPSKERLLEFYDSRAMCDAYDRMQDAVYPGGGRLEIAFDWDVKDIPITNPPVGPLTIKAAQAARRTSSQPETSYGGPPPSSSYQQHQADPRRPAGNYQSPEYDRRGPPEPSYHAPPSNPQQGYNPPPSAGGYGRPGPPPAPYASQGPPPSSSTPSYSYNRANSPPPAAGNYGQGPPQYPPQQYAQSPRPPQGPPPQPSYPQQAPADISNLLATLGDLPGGGRNGPPVPPPGGNYARPPQPPPLFQSGNASGFSASSSAPPSSSASGYPPANYEPTPPSFSRPHEVFSASVPPSSANSSGPPAPATPQMGRGGPPLPGDLLALLGQHQQGRPQQGHQQTPSFEAPRTSPQRAPMQPFPMPPLPPQPNMGAVPPEAAGQQNQVNALLAMLKAQQH